MSRPAFLIYGAILGAFAFAAFGQTLLAGIIPGIVPGMGHPAASSGRVLRVGSEGGTATITEETGRHAMVDDVEEADVPAGGADVLGDAHLIALRCEIDDGLGTVFKRERRQDVSR